MDAGLTPNDALDEFDLVFEHQDFAPEDVIIDTSARVLVSSGREVVDLSSGSPTSFASLPGEVLGLCAAPDGRILACVDGIGLVGVNRDGTLATLIDAGERSLGPLSSVSTLGDEIFVTESSSAGAWADWPRNLMEKAATGAVWRLTSQGHLEKISSGLAWPYGMAFDGADRMLVSESWRHQLVAIQPSTGRVTTVVDRLPAYPARLHARASGEIDVAFFAARNNLVELVLREDEFRAEMMATIPMEDWIRPALQSTRSVREPLQIGRVVNLGTIKPWAPPRSYGLIATLAGNDELVESSHARPGSSRHGTTAVTSDGSRQFVASRGGRSLLARDLSKGNGHV
jgi:hypothetical protein